jgi:hypothetical protein
MVLHRNGPLSCPARLCMLNDRNVIRAPAELEFGTGRLRTNAGLAPACERLAAVLLSNPSDLQPIPGQLMLPKAA